MITAKLKNMKREIMIKKNLKDKNIFIDNDLTWKEKQKKIYGQQRKRKQ